MSCAQTLRRVGAQDGWFHAVPVACELGCNAAAARKLLDDATQAGFLEQRSAVMRGRQQHIYRETEQGEGFLLPD